MSSASFTSGCRLVRPPTVPRASGISIQNRNIPFFYFGVRQAGVSAIFRSEGVHTGFHCPKIISGSQNNGIDPIHDTFVMGHRTIGFHFSDIHCLHKFLSEFLTAQMTVSAKVINFARNFGVNEAFRDIIGKDAHDHGELLFW